jgi:hypothetical protein
MTLSPRADALNIAMTLTLRRGYMDSLVIWALLGHRPRELMGHVSLGHL